MQLPEKYDVLYQHIDDYIDSNGNTEYPKLLANRVACGMIGLGINEIHAPTDFTEKVRSLREILEKPRYAAALKQLELKYCAPHWKVFFLLCRYRWAGALACMLMVIEAIRGRKNRM